MAWSWEGLGSALGGGSDGGILSSEGILGSIYQDMTGQTPAENKWGRSAHSRSNQQQAALGTVGNWAFTGQGPSAAQQLVEMNRAQNAANMVGSAKSMPGGNPALSNQLAAEGIARGNAAATLQGAQIRSQEQQAMIDNYMAGLAEARSQDQEMYGQRLAADQKNTAGRQGFIGGLMGGGGGMLGGILG